MMRLHILGSPELRGASGHLDHSFLAGPKRLALLVYLVLNRPRGFQRRDQILPLFWPDHSQKSARNALSNMLHHMRRALGQGAILSRGAEELSVDPNVLWCDALAFEEALEGGRMREAHALYRGDLLGGLYVPDTAPDLDRWLEQERDRLRRGYWEALETLAGQAEAHGEREAAVAWWRVRAEEDPYDARVVCRLVEALAAVGNRAEALHRARSYARLAEEELGADSEEELRKLMAGLCKTSEATAPRQSTPSRAPCSSAPGLSPRTIAVLPFESLGSDAAAPFAAGLHLDLLTKLSSVEKLTVISRASVLRYVDRKESMSQIAQELGAGSVVEGGVQQVGGRIRLNVQLTDARTGTLRWAEAYDRDLSARDLFHLQSELVEKVAETLRTALTPEEQQRVAEQPTDDLDAYRLYAQGRRHLDDRTQEGIRRALDYFRRAVAEDEQYALAWTGLADAYSILHDYGYERADRALPLAEDAVRRALALDPELAEAHACLGNLHTMRHEGPAAVRELLRAIALRPGYAEAHNWLSWLSNLLGDRELALRSARRAVELSPLSPEPVSNLAFSYLANGDLERALSEARRDRELGSAWGTGKFYEGLALYELSRFEEAEAVLRDLRAPWAGQGPRATWALALVALSERAEAQAVQDEFEVAGETFAAGLVHAALGNGEAAFAAFGREERWGHWPTLAVRHLYRGLWDSLRGDVRYVRLVRELDRSWGGNLEPHSSSTRLSLRL